MGCFGGKDKKYHCTIILLDETEITEEIQARTRGDALLDKVYKYLNLLETAYFGLRYLNKSGESRWLDPLPKVTKQLKGLAPFTLYFGVKFYASDPCKLLEEVTRYQFVLQLKQDILQGRLLVTPDLAAELFALSLQAELGDYDPRKHHKLYVSEFRFFPEQSPELEDKVEKIHKTLLGQVPAAVEMTFLEKVKWLDMYGVDLHPVMGDDHVEYLLGLTPSGIVIMKNKSKINIYFWPRINKVFFKGKYFMVRVVDKANDEMTYGFLLASKESCEYLWKCCVEHHAFFRLTQVKDLSGNPMQIFRLGSKYRYSGRTEQQIRHDMKQIKRPPPTIVRVPSRRFQKRMGEPDGADADVEEKENFKKNIMYGVKDDMALFSNVCPSTLYRSVSTPAVPLAVEAKENISEVPPWEDPNQRGLFSSRQSLVSSRGSERKSSHRCHHKRSSSVESHNSTDSRRRRHHRSKRGSDNESDISKSSRGSRGSRSSRNGSSHRKARNHSRESGSDSDSYHKSRRRKHSSRRSGSNYNLVDSEVQWKMVQKQQREKEASKYQSAVVRDLSNRKSGYMNSGIDTESEAPVHHRKKHRRHSRSRSRSPDMNPIVPNEVKRHIEYHLIDGTNLTEEEKRSIKYTKVETEDVMKIRYSPTSGRPRYKVAKVSSRTSLEKLPRKSNYEDDPPPPYSTLLPSGNAVRNDRRASSVLSATSPTSEKEISVGKSNIVRLGNSKNSNGCANTANIADIAPENSQVNNYVQDHAKHRRRKQEFNGKLIKKNRDISTEL
ncbi:band 4.1-like protein 4 [Uloborus diversus]|uniref:band 4.1-like protein 4 n=1 Tax=Uloborus diversus TaxID=327109 RepID=UPI0024096428|nr:band 4.1-like protein 4 [Uloborus diversus]